MAAVHSKQPSTSIRIVRGEVKAPSSHGGFLVDPLWVSQIFIPYSTSTAVGG